MAPGKKISWNQKILNATASLAGKPNETVSRKAVAKRCGFPKQESKVYSNALGNLRKKEQIKYDKETITILEKGFELAEPDAPIGSNHDALEAALDKATGNKQKEILKICADGKVHTRVEIAKLIGANHTKKSFGNLLSALKTLGYIRYLETEEGAAIQATEGLMPYGGLDE